MVKSNSQINKEANGQSTTLAVVDYRMGQLEVAVKEGFASHDKKLDGLTMNFATKEELSSVQAQLNDWRWYFRALVTAVLLALGTAIGSLVVRR